MSLPAMSALSVSANVLSSVLPTSLLYGPVAATSRPDPYSVDMPSGSLGVSVCCWDEDIEGLEAAVCAQQRVT